MSAEIDPCSVCGVKGWVATQLNVYAVQWVHYECLHVSRRVSLAAIQDTFVCRSCLGQAATDAEVAEFKCGDGTLEVVDRFCYLANVLSLYCGVTDAVSAKIERQAGIVT